MRIYLAGSAALVEDEKRAFQLGRNRLISYFSTLPWRIDSKAVLCNFKWIREGSRMKIYFAGNVGMVERERRKIVYYISKDYFPFSISLPLTRGSTMYLNG
jgi:hypothetical protein